MHTDTQPTMARKRKKARLVSRREPNGRIAREAAEAAQYAPTAVRRLMDAAVRSAHLEEWGTELGRLALEQKITAEMYGAGRWWAQMAADYRRVIGASALAVRGVSMERGSRFAPPDVDSAIGMEIATKDRQIVKAFARAYDALKATGPLATMTVRALCEEDRSPNGVFEFDALKDGLRALAGYRKAGGL